MTKKIRKIFSKIILGIFLPVFLLAPIFSFAQNSAYTINVIFSLNNKIGISDVLNKYQLDAKKVYFSKSIALNGVYKASVGTDVFDQMKNDNSFQYVEEDSKVQAATITISQTASDPFFTMDPTAIDKQWYLAKTRVPDAWDYSKGDKNVVVAVVDTGIHASHIELNDGRIIDGFDVLTGTAIGLGADSDDNGHGTAVAGVIGAIPNNGMGIAGIDWNVKIMPVKVLAADGTGEISDVSAGIVWATDHGANIINLSLGGQGFTADATLSNAITYAYNKGVLIVAASGNDAQDNGRNLDVNPVYPVCNDNGLNMVIGVAATDENDQKAAFSDYGSHCIDISAPGKKIITAAFLPTDPANNILIYGSGTSLATPIVSGIAALIKSSNMNLSNVEIRDILLNTSDNINELNQTNCAGGSCNGFLGKGRVNAFSAIVPKPISEGSLFREIVTDNIFIVSGGVKRLVSDYVFKERGFSADSVIVDMTNQLSHVPDGLPLPPLDGTLIKAQSDPTVFIINQEMKRPLTSLVFKSRGYRFSNVATLPDSEVALYQTGDWYWPPDGTLVLVSGNPTVYVMDKGVRRPVTFFVFNQRHLSFSKVASVTADEFIHIPLPPDLFWLPPLDNTLIKSGADPGIYLIESGTKRLLSLNAFLSKGYSFSNVKVLPESEMDVIVTGTTIE